MLNKFRSEQLDSLFEAILSLETPEECYMFFEDICTVNEINSIAQRWEVAKLLDSSITYNDIVKKTKASTATISRVNKCLIYGAGGYRCILNKIKKEGK